jgi:hypothetical protein
LSNSGIGKYQIGLAGIYRVSAAAYEIDHSDRWKHEHARGRSGSGLAHERPMWVLAGVEGTRASASIQSVNPSHRSLCLIPDLRAPSLLVSRLAGPSPFIPFFFLPQVLSSPDELPRRQHVEPLPVTPRLAAAEKARRTVGDTKPPMSRLDTAEAAERATNLRVEGAGS